MNYAEYIKTLNDEELANELHLIYLRGCMDVYQAEEHDFYNVETMRMDSDEAAELLGIAEGDPETV